MMSCMHFINLMEERKMQKLSETYFREEPEMEREPKSDRLMQIEEFAHNKEKKQISRMASL